MAKKLVIAILVVLLLGGGAGGYVFFGGQGDDAQAAQAIEAKPPAFLTMNPMTLPAIRGDGVRKLVGFRIVLELDSGRSLSEVTPWLPRMEDAFVTELTALLAVDWPGRDAIDFGIARERLLRESERVLGPGLVANVLFEQIQVRDL